MSFDLEKLYALLPAIYRTRDLELAAAMGLRLDDQEETELQNLLALASQVSKAQAARRQELLEKQRRASGPLKALLSVIAEQIAVLEEDLDQLYDDLFIETCAEWVVPYDPNAINTAYARGKPQPPSAEHIFGTDNYGRDYLSRAMVGTRVSLAVGVAAVVFQIVIGGSVGVSDDVFRTWCDGCGEAQCVVFDCG